MPSTPLRDLAFSQVPLPVDEVCACRIRTCQLCKLRGQPHMQQKVLQLMNYIRQVLLKAGVSSEGAERAAQRTRLIDPEVQKQRKWRELKDTALLLLSIITTSTSEHVSLCGLILQPTYHESMHRYNVLTILKQCGVLNWMEEEGFDARVTSCGHKRRLHMMHIDEDFQEAELCLNYTFRNPRFT